ncbi:DarT ssDNA thymidine ADP-ribosyltransferase family protein [Vreelandella venusta]|uniref:DarT ssDNA thymidine ADP-ribosyltransferase family protein n=1 Tax=Vreelandella venusta TaxID=44935 RepID=UPI003F67548B
MSNWVTKFKIGSFYHFTDVSNVEMIKAQGGLLSLAELNRRGIKDFKPGGNQWSHEADQRVGVDNYVHLSFVSQHPMEYVARRDERINETAWIKINPAIVYEHGVLFVNDVSNKAGVTPFGFVEVEDKIDLEVLYGGLNWRVQEIMDRRKIALKSEILIPNFIPLDKIWIA